MREQCSVKAEPTTRKTDKRLLPILSGRLWVKVDIANLSSFRNKTFSFREELTNVLTRRRRG